MKIESISISKKKGTRKYQIDEAEIVKDHGVKGDAHAGPWHRQVSFLAMESIKKSQDEGLDISFGDFAENIATSGVDWKNIHVGARVRLGNTALVEITQIGKVCHNKCAIFYQAGDCIMPREGIFAKVVKGGNIRRGDMIQLID